jgi:hypothetical protein
MMLKKKATILFALVEPHRLPDFVDHMASRHYSDLVVSEDEEFAKDPLSLEGWMASLPDQRADPCEGY